MSDSGKIVLDNLTGLTRSAVACIDGLLAKAKACLAERARL